ncbi:hypothetical protein ERJ75_000075400 [Trypanosoma vivax]|nr:hypothetical protein ERJ75_000075400 [Trypanosoma vivax]
MRQAPKKWGGPVSFAKRRQKPTKGWIVRFIVVEEAPAEPRRRFVAWPKGENDRDDCEAEALLWHAIRALSLATSRPYLI